MRVILKRGKKLVTDFVLDGDRNRELLKEWLMKCSLAKKQQSDQMVSVYLPSTIGNIKVMLTTCKEGAYHIEIYNAGTMKST